MVTLQSLWLWRSQQLTVGNFNLKSQIFPILFWLSIHYFAIGVHFAFAEFYFPTLHQLVRKLWGNLKHQVISPARDLKHYIICSRFSAYDMVWDQVVKFDSKYRNFEEAIYDANLGWLALSPSSRTIIKWKNTTKIVFKVVFHIYLLIFHKCHIASHFHVSVWLLSTLKLYR